MLRIPFSKTPFAPSDSILRDAERPFKQTIGKNGTHFSGLRNVPERSEKSVRTDTDGTISMVRERSPAQSSGYAAPAFYATEKRPRISAGPPYYYYIHRWAGSRTISSSSAKIQIHQGSTLIKEFNVPTSLGSGDYWNVFAIVNGRLVVRNTMTSSPETSYINADGSMVRGASTHNLQGSSDNMTSKETTSDEVSADSQTDAVSSSVESSAPESTEATVVSSEPASVSTEDVTSATEESSTEEYPISSSEDTAPATPKTQNQTATVPAQKEEADDVSPSNANK